MSITRTLQYERTLSHAATAILSVALAATPSALTAQNPQLPLNGPVTFVTLDEYNQLVAQKKAFPVSAQALQQQQQAADRVYQDDLEYVRAYLAAHPNLTRLAALVNTLPNTANGNPRGIVEIDGGYQVPLTDSQGFKTTVQTMGQQQKIEAIANSLRSANDPKTQLKVYTEIYNKIPDEYLNSEAGKDIIHPSQLEDASLSTILGALKTVVSQVDDIVKAMPKPVELHKAKGCGDEEGAGTAPQTTWGDRTQSTGCTTPSSQGIYDKFNFSGKSQLSCIKNQGQRGTCHIFAATSLVEQVIARDLGKHVNLSEQDFMENEKLLWGPSWFNDSGDGGTDLTNAAAFGYNFAWEDQWEYNPSLVGIESATTPTTYTDMCDSYPLACSDSAPQAPGICVSGMDLCALVPAPIFGSTGYQALPPFPIPIIPSDWSFTIGLMKLFFAANDPVMMGFTATDDFQNTLPNGYIQYQSSDVTNPNDILGGHMVHVVGYVTNSDLAAKIPGAPAGKGGGYFIIKNSWGNCFGDAGYVYMPVEYLEVEAWELWFLPAMID